MRGPHNTVRRSSPVNFDLALNEPSEGRKLADAPAMEPVLLLNGDEADDPLVRKWLWLEE